MLDGPEDESLEPTDSSGENNGTPPAIEGEVVAPAKKRGRVENLKPFKKGHSGNPGGRPKRGPLTDALALIAEKRTPEELLAKIPPSVAKVLGKKPTLAQVLMFRLMYMAIAGDVGATRLVFERLEGKVKGDIQQSDDSKMDELMDVLGMGGMPAGSVNEGADDGPPEL
jgi:hypothetical protein